MMFPKKEIVDEVKKEYPSGTRVELISMSDPFVAMEAGIKGTVATVDDTATIHVNWDNGHRLGIVYGEDSCRKLDTVKTFCYGDEKVWNSRQEAVDFFYKAILGSEGSEQQRYSKIYLELLEGKEVCTDDDEEE